MEEDFDKDKNYYANKNNELNLIETLDNWVKTNKPKKIPPLEIMNTPHHL